MFYAYIKQLRTHKLLWSGYFKTELLAERALIRAYKDLGFNPEDPACMSDIGSLDDDEEEVR